VLRDLELLQQHTARLRRELATAREDGQRLLGTSRTIGKGIQEQRRRLDLLRSARCLRERGCEELRAAEGDRKLLRSCREIRDAQKNYLRQKARLIALQMQRYARTCEVSRSTAIRLEVSLRGQARVSIEPVVNGAAASLVQISLQPPPESVSQYSGSVCTDGLRELGRELLLLAWGDIMDRLLARVTGKAAIAAAAAAPQRDATGLHLEMVVACGEVPEIVRRLDRVALVISHQLEALSRLPTDCPEVVHVRAALRDTSNSPVLLITTTLLFVHSHVVIEGPDGCLVVQARPQGPSASNVTRGADAAEYIFEFSTDLAGFPDTVSVSDVKVQQVFGRVARGLCTQVAANALHGPVGSLTAVLARAIEALRQGAPPPLPHGASRDRSRTRTACARRASGL